MGMLFQRRNTISKQIDDAWQCSSEHIFQSVQRLVNGSLSKSDLNGQILYWIFNRYQIGSRTLVYLSLSGDNATDIAICSTATVYVLDMSFSANRLICCCVFGIFCRVIISRRDSYHCKSTSYKLFRINCCACRYGVPIFIKYMIYLLPISKCKYGRQAVGSYQVCIWP